MRPTATLEEQIAEAREEYIRAKELVEKVKRIDNVKDAGPIYNQPLMAAEKRLRDLLKQRGQGPQAIETRRPPTRSELAKKYGDTPTERLWPDIPLSKRHRDLAKRFLEEHGYVPYDESMGADRADTYEEIGPDTTRVYTTHANKRGYTVKTFKNPTYKQLRNWMGYDGPQAIEIRTPEEEKKVLDDAANLNKEDMPEADPTVEQPVGKKYEIKTAEELDNAVNQVVVSRPRYSKGLMVGLRDMFSRFASWAQKYYIQLLSLAQIYELFPELTGVRKLEEVIQSRARKKDIETKKAAENVLRYKKTEAKFDKKIVAKWNRITNELSRQNIDPRDVNNFAEPLVVEYLNLPKELQEISNETADIYEQYAEDTIKVFERESPLVAEKMRTKLKSGKLNFYQPFMRDGDYWFDYEIKMPDGSQERVVIASQSPSERKKLMAEAKTKKDYVPKSMSAPYRRPPPLKNSFPDSKFNQEIQEMVNEHVQDPALREGMLERIHELYISKFSADALRQQQQHREGHRGEIQDVIFAYANMSKRSINSINDMAFIPEIVSAMAEVKDQTSRDGAAPDHKGIYEALNNRISFFMHPTAQKWASTAGWLSYAWYIGGNMSSAVVNLTQLPIVVYPMLGAEYGMGKALSAMDTARGLYFKGNLQKRTTSDLPDYTMAEGFTPTQKKKYGALFKAAEDSMTLSRGLVHENTDFQSFGSELGDTANTINQGLGWVFKNSERANREITLVAAYDLAVAKGMKREDAIQKAIKLTVKAHSHALPEAGPLLFQQGIGKVAFTFKRFAQAQIYLVSRLFHQAFKGKDAKTKSIAAKQLLGIYAGSFAFAGIQGMPFYGAADALASLLLDDEDDPFLLDDAVRDSFGQLGYKGPISQAFNIDLAGRTGFLGLAWRSDPRRREEVGDAVYFAEHFGGPSWSILVGIDRGIKDIENGNITRGVEQMTPTWFRNFVKANRFATEGATTRKGLKITDDPNAYNIAMQLFGFSETDLSEAYERVSSMKRAEGRLVNRKRTLLLRLHLARESGDMNGVSEINEEIRDFNKVVPHGFRITGKSKNKSRRAFRNKAREAVHGVSLNSKLRDELLDRYGDEDEDY